MISSYIARMNCVQSKRNIGDLAIESEFQKAQEVGISQVIGVS